VISNINRLKEELEKIADDTTSQNPETDERELVAEENSQLEVAVGTYPEEVEKIASGVPVEEMEKLLKEYEEKSKQEMDELRRVIEEQDKELKRRREQKTDQSSQQNEESKENNEEDHAGKLIKNAEEALSQARRSLASTPVEELNGFNFPSVAGNEGNNHSCPKCGANSNPEANSDKSKRSHSRSSSRNSFRRSGSFDVSESFQKIAQLKEQLKAQENEVVSLNTRCAALEGEKIRLEEELERVNDNRSTKAHHSRETSNDTDISGTLEPNDFNPDDKDRKIVDLQSELEEIKRELALSKSGEHNCSNKCCINGDYEDIKRKNSDLKSQNISLEALLNEQSPTGSMKKERSDIFPEPD